jgi:predicted transcriptional regulator
VPDTTRFKTAIYQQIARIGKATASAVRLEILDLLAQGPRTVEAIAGQVAQSVARHTCRFASARLVDTERPACSSRPTCGPGRLALTLSCARWPGNGEIDA